MQDLGLRRELSRSLTLSAVIVERGQRSAHGMRDVVVVRSRCIGSVRRHVPSRLIFFVPANDSYLRKHSHRDNGHDSGMIVVPVGYGMGMQK